MRRSITFSKQFRSTIQCKPCDKQERGKQLEINKQRLICSLLQVSLPLVRSARHAVQHFETVTHAPNLTMICPVVGKKHPCLQQSLYITAHHTNNLQSQQTCLSLLTASTYISGYSFLGSFLISHIPIFGQESDYIDGAYFFSLFPQLMCFSFQLCLK